MSSKRTWAAVLIGLSVVLAVFLLLRGGAEPGAPRPRAGGSGEPASALESPAVRRAAVPGSEPEGGRERVQREDVGAGSIALRVVDAAGEPVAHAEVRVLPWTDDVRARAASLRGLTEADLLSLVETPEETDPGTFPLRWRGPMFLTARTAALAPSGLLVTDPPADGALELRLSPGASLTGGVQATYADDPLLDVVVRARRDTALEVRFGVDPLAAQRVAGLLWTWTARPDPKGRFALTGLPPGRVVVQAFGRGRASDRVSTLVPDFDEVWLRLHRSTELRGRAVDAKTGRGVGGVRIVALEPLNNYQFHEIEEAFSEDDGTFVLEGLRSGRAGTLPLRAQKGGYASQFVEVDAAIVEAGGEARVELWPACTVHGTVTSRGEEPGEVCWVSLQDAARGVLVDFAQTDEKGAFTLSFARPGQSYDVVVSSDHHVARTWEDVEVCSAEDLRFDIVRRPLLEGRLVADEAPLKSPRVVVAFEDTFGNRIFERNVAVDPKTGAFRDDTLTPGSYLVEAWADGFAPVRVPAVNLAEDAEEPVRLELKLSPGSAVVGRVVDGGTGAPVVGAHVELGRPHQDGAIGAWSEAGPRADSDGEGRFELDGVPESGAVHLVVTAPGYARKAFRVPAATGEGAVSVGDVRLDRAGRIEFEVVDGDGRRLSLADVWGEFSGTPPLRVHREAHGGLAVLEDLPPGRWGLSAVIVGGGVSRGFSREVELAAGEVRRERFRFAGATVHGRLQKDGRVVSSWYVVQALPVDGGEEDGAYVFSGGDGSYELAGIPAGPTRIVVQAGDLLGGLRLEKIVDVPPSGDLTVDFAVGPGGISGRVVDAEGHPLGDVRITASKASDESGDTAAGGELAGRSGPDGRFELLGLAAGVYEVTFVREGFGAESREATAGEGEDAKADLGDVVLEREARLRVETRSRGGGPLDARVDVERLDHEDFLDRTGSESPDGAPGVRLFDALAPGRYRVRAEADGHFPAEGVVELAAGAARDVVYTLRRLGALAVRTKGPSGPLEGVPVTIEDEETGTDVVEWVGAGLVTSSTGGLVSGEDGWLRLERLPEGRYVLRAGAAVRHVEVPAAGPDVEVPEVTLFVGP